MPRKYALALLFIALIVTLVTLLLQPSPSQAQIPPWGTNPFYIFTLTTSPPPLFPTATSPFDIFTLTPGYVQTATYTPWPSMSPPPTSVAPGCGTRFPIVIGDQVLVISGVLVRNGPTVNAPLLTAVENTTAGWYVVRDGPVCADNYTWWLVDGSFNLGTELEPEIVTVRGWIIERNVNFNFVVDYAPAAGYCAPALDLAVGATVELTGNVRIRNAPSLGGLVLTIAPFGSVVTVLNATTTCADGYVWRQVQAQVANFVYDGWMAEGTRLAADVSGQVGSQSYLDTGAGDCYPPLDFASGSLARVDYLGNIPKNLRDAPGSTAQVLYTLVEGVPVEVIGGPVCVEGMNWWQVRVMASFPVSGWIAEGRRGDYWLRDFYDNPEFDPPH